MGRCAQLIYCLPPITLPPRGQPAEKEALEPTKKKERGVTAHEKKKKKLQSPPTRKEKRPLLEPMRKKRKEASEPMRKRRRKEAFIRAHKRKRARAEKMDRGQSQQKKKEATYPWRLC